MKKISNIVLCTFGIFLFMSQITSACSYMYQSPQETYNQNENVFIGEITKTSVKGGINGTRSITFQVLKTYKGSFSKTVTLTTGANSAMCGFEDATLNIGDIWVIHTSDSNSFNSLAHNKTYEFFEDAKSALDPLSQDDKPKFCPLNYAPVCARRDIGIKCVTTPCLSTEDKTYGNACQADVDNADFLYDGECRSDTKPPIVTNPPVKQPPQELENNVSNEQDDAPEVSDDVYEKKPLSERIFEKVNNFFRWLFRLS